MRCYIRRLSLQLVFMLTGLAVFAQDNNAKDPGFTHADTLRGSITPQRAWWDLMYYDIDIEVNPSSRSIKGKNTIYFNVLQSGEWLQVDLQSPLIIDSVIGMQKGAYAKYTYIRDGNVYFVHTTQFSPGQRSQLTVYYHGIPRVAVRPPWDGGFTWSKDSAGKPWVGLSCQGLGASVWLPCKDHQYDEPDSVRLRVTVPKGLVDVSGGKLVSRKMVSDSTEAFTWFTANPINNYDISLNIGDYTHFSDLYQGLGGELPLDFWVLKADLQVAKHQFLQVKPMLSCFEKWFGPYPFYKDGYKLVETPYLGMEHQSAIAYGNHFKNGYLGRDLSRTGLGMKWDYIIIHESAHEWFGNNITTKDIADMWVHEAFAMYAESLFTQCQLNRLEGERYIRGVRSLVSNDRPITGVYGLNNEGSDDMYYKGANMLNTIRQIVGSDLKWRSILQGVNTTFYHQTVTAAQIEAYISQAAGKDLSTIFKQYLETRTIPVFEYKTAGNTLSYKWTNTVAGFNMPIKISSSAGVLWVYPETKWKSAPVPGKSIRVDPNFYVVARND